MLESSSHPSSPATPDYLFNGVVANFNIMFIFCPHICSRITLGLFTETSLPKWPSWLPPKNWIHTVWNMEHNFGIYLSVNFMCGIRPPCRTAVCYQSVCHIVGELGSRAAWHYLIIHEGPVSSSQEKSQTFFINFSCYIINMEQLYSYVLYKLCQFQA